jgi:hypothetical protein
MLPEGVNRVEAVLEPADHAAIGIVVVVLPERDLARQLITGL